MSLLVNLSELYSNGFVDIDLVYSFDKEMLKDTEILELNDVSIKGEIRKNSLDEFIINIIIKGTMVLPCAVSLKPVDYDFSIEIDDDLSEIMEKNIKISENKQKTIDILSIIWENILMEIPIRVVSEDISDVKTKGEGWELITDEEDMVNPSLAKLKDLL